MARYAGACVSCGRRHCLECRVEIADQIVSGFQSYVEADEPVPMVIKRSIEPRVDNSETGHPPQLSPILNMFNESTKSVTCVWVNFGLKRKENTLVDPVKSRLQMSWPGHVGKAG